ncbi:hypothetical protein RHECIAT_CH0003308 [Rhizobium etli CIAT 652]|uniref:Uncharacterized protein n=1 Tax=Rhizobium etli (strain CIAT 652) TaxID=491916 RepID=B3PVN6_RHIE6|nr:hypothetical protein RHECIAT_CH0003308 [Rhizobium etli CIAT 652]
MTRRSRKTISDTTPQPLAIIAGLPKPNNEAVAKEVAAKFPTWKVIATPFPRDPKAPYSDDGAILDFVRAVCSFAEQQSEKTPPRPGQLVLLYIEDDAAHRMLDVFGFSTFAVPLKKSDWDWPAGRHWRSHFHVVTDLVLDALSMVVANEGEELKIRLERADPNDILLLPPRNFHVSDGERLFERFDRHHRASTVLDIEDEDIASEEFTVERLPTFFKKTGEVRRNFRIDDRGLVYATSRKGQHGPARMLNISTEKSLLAFRPLLESIFRFGTPLRDGFQHDAQWEDDKHLVNVDFVDIDEPIKLSQSHANIYGNDRVR